MKKLLSLTLAAVLALGLALPALAAGEDMAVATTQDVEVDGVAVKFETYALLDANGYQTNYAKLRDVAQVLNSTPARFSVDWSAREGIQVTVGGAYISDGTEMSTPYSGDRVCQLLDETTQVDGVAQNISAIRLFDDEGNGYTYYKLRDLGNYLGFYVDWSASRGVFVETDKVYSGAKRTDIQALAGTWSGKLDLGDAFASAVREQPGLAPYFDFDREELPLTLVSDAAGRRTLSVAQGADAALERVKKIFLDGMLAYAEDQLKSTVGMTLDQALQQASLTREAFATQFETLFDDTMDQALGRLGASGSWTAAEAASILKGADTLEITLDDGDVVRFTRR